jgi:hypothetical protein
VTQMVSAERAAALRKAVNVSAPGTIETCRRTLKRSAYGGRPEVVCARSKRRFDPDLTSNGCRTTSDRVGIPPRNGGNALGGFLRLVAEYVSYFALRTTDRRNYTVPVPPIAGARRQCLIDDRSPSVEIPGSANQVDLVEAARQKSEAATEARTSAWSIRARSKLGRCGCARFPANRVQARIW